MSKTSKIVKNTGLKPSLHLTTKRRLSGCLPNGPAERLAEAATVPELQEKSPKKKASISSDKYDDLLRRNRELAKSNSHLSKRYVEVHNRMNKDGNSYRLEIQMLRGQIEEMAQGHKKDIARIKELFLTVIDSVPDCQNEPE